VRCCGQDVCEVGKLLFSESGWRQLWQPHFSGSDPSSISQQHIHEYDCAKSNLIVPGAATRDSYLCPTIRFRRRWKREGANSIYIIAEESFREFSLLCAHFHLQLLFLYNNSTISCSLRGQNFLHQSHSHKINQNYNHALTPQLIFKRLCVQQKNDCFLLTCSSKRGNYGKWTVVQTHTLYE
jgi:hypothetical protein